MFEHSTKERSWRVSPEPDIAVCNAVANSLKLSPAAAKLLCARGFDTARAAKAFIGSETEQLHDPFLLADMDKAVARIRKALVNREKIVVYGDYDVDGVTSVSILYSYLQIHSADVTYYIPNRIGEGYGINADALKTFAEEGYKLMITVDTGITAIDEIANAKKLGLDTVVTDHHECRELLPDCPVVNPRRPDCPYPFKELAGVGVAFKLICALEKDLRSTTLYNAVKLAVNRCGELVAIGTIADVMPLVDENRVIVKYGLSLLEKTSNAGIKALMLASGVTETAPDGEVVFKKKVSSSLVGYTLAPRINAAGRISNATLAVELFLTEYKDRATEIATELCEINRERQAQENQITSEADRSIAEQCSPEDYVIVLAGDHWHHGVIGIVCSRLTERYNLPSILVSFEGQSSEPPASEDIGKGSGRSIKGFNLVEALGKCSDKLVKYGGHELAAGLSIERGKLTEFRRAINKLAAKTFEGKEPERIVDIDIILEPTEISMKLCEELWLLEPFGVANAQPVFETDRFIITDITPLAGRRHTKLTVKSRSHSFTALCFGMPTDEVELGFAVGDLVDLVYNLDINEYRGHSSVQLLVRDIRRSKPPVGCPTREDFARLWRMIKDFTRRGIRHYPLSHLADSAKLGEAETALMLEVFCRMGLLRVFREGGEIAALPVPNAPRSTENPSTLYAQLMNDKG